MITPQKLAGYRDDFAKSEFIHKTFSDAQKSAVSVVILDSIEQLIGWNPIGPRFSMTVLGTLSALITSPPINVSFIHMVATFTLANYSRRGTVC
jgi:vesicle-fusing ATPase